MSKKLKLTDIPGLGPKTAKSLEEAGIKTVLKLSKMKADKLASMVEGIGETTAQKFIDEAQKLVPSEPKEEKREVKAKEKKPIKKEPAKEEKPSKKKPEVKEEKPTKPAEKAEKVKPKAPVKSAIAAPKLKEKPTKKIPKKKSRVEKKVEPKPELLTRQQIIGSRLFRVAAAKRHRQPSFRHEHSHRWVRVGDSWRKVRGIDSKTREKRKGSPALVTPGYRKPKTVRGIHPSGYVEVQVYRSSELDDLNPEVHAVRIGSTVGLRKRQEILKKAESMTLRVLNPGAPETVVEEELFSELDMLDEVEVE